MSDVYSFTTTEDDAFMDRVAEETSRNKNIFVVREDSTTSDVSSIYILMREDFFNDVTDRYPAEKFAGYTLGDTFLRGLLVPERLINGYRVFLNVGLTRAEADKEEVTIKNDIKRLKNLAEGRTVRVHVSSY